MTPEQIQANLRNLLIPHFNLAAMVLIENKNDDIIKIMQREAKLIQSNKYKVLELIEKIEKSK